MNQESKENLAELKKEVIDSMVDYLEDAIGDYDQTHIDQCEKYLDEYANDVAKAEGDFIKIMALVEVVVVSLNQLNETCKHSLIETDQRECICEFINQVIIENGIDLDALASSQQCSDITEEWREW
jgi:hypothetical protein